MAARTAFHLGAVGGGRQAPGEAGVRLPPIGLAGPGQVRGGRTVATLATDAGSQPLAVEAAAGGVVIAFETGVVALHAHEVGVLLWLAPVQRMAGIHAFVRVQVEPGLASGIPGHAQGLQLSAAGVQQILLERLHAEGVAHLEVGVAAVGAGRIHPVRVTLAVEAGGFPGVAETHVGEVAEDAPGAGRLHRQLVVRAAPLFALPGVAGLAGAFVDQAGGRAGRDRRGPRQRRAPEQARAVAGAAAGKGWAGVSPVGHEGHAHGLPKSFCADPTQLPRKRPSPVSRTLPAP